MASEYLSNNPNNADNWFVVPLAAVPLWSNTCINKQPFQQNNINHLNTNQQTLKSNTNNPQAQTPRPNKIVKPKKKENE